MTVAQLQQEHLSWCLKVGQKSKRCKRNLLSDKCAHCVVDFIDMRAQFEKYNRSIQDNVAPSVASVSEEEVNKGVLALVQNVRDGYAEVMYPPGSRLVIGDLIWEVVDHDTIKVNGVEHTMTLRLFTRDYLEKVFDKTKGRHSWEQSDLRTYLNEEFASTYICQALRNVILPVVNTQTEIVEVRTPCDCGCGGEHVSTEQTTVSCVDTVWLPSVTQLGFEYDENDPNPDEGDILDAFDPQLTLVRKGRIIVAEYFNDTIAHKMYWTRTSRKNADPAVNSTYTYKVDWNGNLAEETDAYETTAMVVPFITIG